MATADRHEDAILTRTWNLSNASSWTVNFWKRPITGPDENAGTPTQGVSAPCSNAYFLGGLPLFAVTGALSLAVFLVAMDVNIIVTAVPRITNDFQSLNDIGWYGCAFLMTACVFQIPFGRFYSLFAIKFVFLAAVLIFMAGSLAAGLAPKSPVFILGRAVQGIGASGILSGGLIIMAEVIPVKTRPYVGAIIGALEGVAMISGPILGGVLAERLHWRWCFYINLPIGGLVLATIVAFLNIPQKTTEKRAEESTWEAKIRRLDPVGFFFLLPSLVCLLLGIQYGGRSPLHSQDKTAGRDRNSSLILTQTRHYIRLEQQPRHSAPCTRYFALRPLCVLAVRQQRNRHDSHSHTETTIDHRRLLAYFLYFQRPGRRDLLCGYSKYSVLRI